jgi:site-specific DNA recombinase
MRQRIGIREHFGRGNATTILIVAGHRADELRLVRDRIERLVDAIAEGTPAAAVRDRLESLEARRLTLEAEVATSLAPAPRLHPALAEVYRQKVANLVAALEGDDAAEARELLRSLVDSITLHPEEKGQRVEVRGELAAILGLASCGAAIKAGGSTDVLAVQMKMVAGTGFEPVTFRL